MCYPQLLPDALAAIFQESIGGWHFIDQDPNFLDAPPADISKYPALRRSIIAASVVQIGVVSLVIPTERWKRLIKNTGLKDLDFSLAFDLDIYEDQATFQHAYRKTHVITFERPKGYNMGWLASVLRNAVAHGQVKTHFAPGITTIEMWNIDGTGVCNFRVQMPLREYTTLMAHSLKTFISFVTNRHEYLPLTGYLYPYLGVPIP